MEQLKAKIRGTEISYLVKNAHASETIVLLHGFTGSTCTWQSVMDLMPKDIKCIAIDLLGHGNTSAPDEPARYEMEEQLLDINGLLQYLEVACFTLAGYSMGGRIALAYAITYPESVKNLVLESASPGLPGLQERNSRIVADQLLADKIQREGLESFVDFWENIPLFDSQKRLTQMMRQAIRAERLKQREIGLANSLRGIGTGKQPSYWEELGKLKMPVWLITGELDRKFCAIAKKMAKSNSQFHHVEVSDAGHAIHVENPRFFATIIKEQVINPIQGGRI